MATDTDTSRPLKQLAIAPVLWIPCPTCKLVTRHVLSNPDDCAKDHANFICCRGGVLCHRYMMAKEFFTLFRGCIVADGDDSLVFVKDSEKKEEKNEKENPITVSPECPEAFAFRQLTLYVDNFLSKYEPEEEEEKGV